MKRKFFSILTALALCLGLCPTWVLAQETGYRTQRTSQLILSSFYDSQDKLDTEGWKWDKENLTLTLNGLDMDYTGNRQAIYYSKPNSPVVTIIVEGQNRIRTGGGGIYVGAELDIRGGGTLEIESKSDGISSRKLTISNVTIKAVSTNTTDGNTNAGISCSGGLTIENSNITAESPYGRGIVLDNGATTSISISNSTVDTSKCIGYGIYRDVSNTDGSIIFDENSTVTGLLVESQYGNATVMGTVSTRLRYREKFTSVTVMENAEWTTSSQTLVVESGATLTNDGTINFAAGIELYGMMANRGTLSGGISVQSSGILTNHESGNMSGSNLRVYGNGTFVNRGTGPNGEVASWDALWRQLGSLPKNAVDPTPITVTDDLVTDDDGFRRMEGAVKAVVDGGSHTVSTGIERIYRAAVLSDGAELTLKNLTLQSKGPAPMFHVSEGTLIVGEGTTFTTSDSNPHYIHVNRPTINGSQNSNGHIVVDKDFADGETLNIYVNQLEAFLTEDMLGDPGQLGTPNVPEGTVVATAADGRTLSLEHIRLVEKVYNGTTPSMKVVAQGEKTEWGQYLALSEDSKEAVVKIMYWPVLKDTSMGAVGQPDQPLKDFLIDAVVTDQFGRTIEGAWTWKNEGGTDASNVVPEAGGGTAYLAEFVPAAGARSEFYEIPLTVRIVPVVKEVIRVSGVTLSQSALTLEQGGEVRLTAVVSPDNATIKSVIWESSDTNVATVDNNGRISAVGIGSAVITVTTTDGDKTASCTVTVTAPAIHVTGVSLNKTDLTLTAGDSEQLTATVAPSDATDKSVTWASSNAAVAAVDSSGNVTAIGAGTATITVTTADGAKTAACTVTVSTNSGGGGGGGSTTSSPTVTIPVSGDKGTVHVSASVSGTTATVSKIDTSQIENVIGDNGQASMVEIDFTGLGKTIDTVKLPAAAIKDIAAKAQNEEVRGLTVKLPEAEISFDANALSAIQAQAGSQITLTVTPAKPADLNSRQKEAVGNAPVFNLTLRSSSGAITDFRGGYATVSLPYTLAAGQNPSGVVVYYLDSTGNITPCPTMYDVRSKSAIFTTGHLSLYFVGYDPAAVWVNPFSDVAGDAWYYDAVRYASENGLMGGYGNGMFGPNDNLSRAQFAQILFNKEGRPVVNYLLRYNDVADGAWYTEAIRWATSRGIVGGYGNGMFGPNDNITREQLAVMLWRYAGSPAATDKELHFTDADQASGFALDALRWAVEKGIINGYGNGQLAPQGLATRGQVAQMLMNFLKNR